MSDAARYWEEIVGREEIAINEIILDRADPPLNRLTVVEKKCLSESDRIRIAIAEAEQRRVELLREVDRQMQQPQRRADDEAELPEEDEGRHTISVFTDTLRYWLCIIAILISHLFSGSSM
ncbi:hypothetical protein QR680_004333 [Steinernema hermaphroditum]|uniref:Uncharacterized protein n=1 Tax=Steinernema hermaphroditum TaxID=289476 RepID=A0AA39HNC6_9BILA|nr:hypothetical protein QR680_004333 [Steinernema hermaphroditum]